MNEGYVTSVINTAVDGGSGAPERAGILGDPEIERAHRQIVNSVWLAVQALQDVVMHGKDRERVLAAKEILDRAGLVARTTATANKIKDLTEMDSADLAALVEQARFELSNRAKPARRRNAPDAPQDPAKVVDLLD